MTPEEARKFISQHRLTYDQSQAQSSFDEIKELLKKEKGFSQRQADWAIELYITNMEEIVLTNRIKDIEH